MKISEKQLEDWMVENWDETMAMHFGRFIGQQVRLPHGRLDILSGAVHLNTIYVIELKSRKLKEKDIGQLLRYIGDLKAILRNLSSWVENGTLERPYHLDTSRERSEADEIFSALCGWHTSGEAGRLLITEGRTVNGVLVGKSVEDSLFASAFGAGIEIYSWNYKGSGECFSINPVQRQIMKTLERTRDWLFDHISQEVRDIYLHIAQATERVVWNREKLLYRELFGTEKQPIVSERELKN